MAALLPSRLAGASASVPFCSAGADEVVAAEVSQHMCDVGEEVCIMNGFLGRITMLDRCGLWAAGGERRGLEAVWLYMRVGKCINHWLQARMEMPRHAGGQAGVYSKSFPTPVPRRDARRLDVLRKADGTPPDLPRRADLLVYEVGGCGVMLLGWRPWCKQGNPNGWMHILVCCYLPAAPAGNPYSTA